MPTDKDGLLAYLAERNVPHGDESTVGRAAGAIEPDDRRESHFAEIAEALAPAPATIPADAERQARRAEKIAQGRDVDALLDWLFQAEPWQVERVLSGVAARVADLTGTGRAAA